MALTAADLAQHLNLDLVNDIGADGSPARVEFDRILAAAVEHVTMTCGWPDGAAIIRVDGDCGGRLVLPVAHLMSIGVVTSPSGVATVPTSSDGLAGLVQVPSREEGVWTVAVVGSPWPAGLQFAALEIGRHLYQTQRAQLGTDPGEDPGTPTFSIPRRATELMKPYRLAGGFG